MVDGRVSDCVTVSVMVGGRVSDSVTGGLDCWLYSVGLCNSGT